MTLGEALRQVKEATKISGRELSIEIGVNQYRLQKWIDNTANPKHEDAQIILKFFGVESIDKISEKVLSKTISNIQNSKKGTPEVSKWGITNTGEAENLEKNRSPNETSEALQAYKKEDFREKYYELLEKHDKRFADLEWTIKSQQETIHFLATKGGGVNGHAAATG